MATRQFAEEGFGGVTLRGLAAELGCSPMTPYRYFHNKEEIFDVVRIDCFREFAKRIGDAATQHDHPMERLRRPGQGLHPLRRGGAAALPHHVQLDRPEGSIDPPEHDALGRSWHILLETIQSCIEAGHLEGDPVDLAHYCWFSLHGAVTLHLANRLRWGRSLDDLVEPMLENVYRGSAARPQTEQDR